MKIRTIWSGQTFGCFESWLIEIGWLFACRFVCTFVPRIVGWSTRLTIKIRNSFNKSKKVLTVEKENQDQICFLSAIMNRSIENLEKRVKIKKDRKSQQC